jgi:hypothetical protein
MPIRALMVPNTAMYFVLNGVAEPLKICFSLQQAIREVEESAYEYDFIDIFNMSGRKLNSYKLEVDTLENNITRVYVLPYEYQDDK